MTDLTQMEPLQVNIGEIRRELRNLWASEAMNDEAVIRASTHNLIVFVADHAAAEETTRRIVELTAERPGRVILIDVEPGDDNRVEAWVTTYCRTFGKKQICGELITLAVRGTLRDEIHSTVISLLAPDLPVFLWWTCDLDPANHLFERLSRNADRVVVDSTLLGDAAQGLREIAGLPETLHIGDLNWARITPWRRALAQLWDLRSMQQQLRGLRTVEIVYSSTENWQNSENALLMAGWLAQMLGWKFDSATVEDPNVCTIEWHTGDLRGVITLHARVEEDTPAGEVTQISIESGEKQSPVKTTLALHSGEACLEIKPTEQERPIIRSYKSVTIGAALAEEIDLGHDPVYRKALLRAVEILNICSQVRDQETS
jgi:glucose-6-phosphate dehydrogenase assembly protein OpcA